MVARRTGALLHASSCSRLADPVPASSACEDGCMYLIVVKFPVKPESVDRWMDVVADYTAACRAEAGNLFFEWSRSVEDPHEFVLVEAFTDEGAAAHVQAPHFQQGIDAMRPHITATPKIVSRQVDGHGWDEMGELRIG